MSVKFIPNSHLVFSASKDWKIRQFDADKFVLTQVLNGHFGAVNWIDVSNGKRVYSVSNDRTIRWWM